MNALLPERFAPHVLSLLAATALFAVSGCGSSVIDEPMDPPADARTRKDAAPGSEGGGSDPGVLPGTPDGAVPDPDTAGGDPDTAFDDTAVDPGPGPDPDGGGSDPCTTCVETHCGAELTACEADAACKKQFDCIDACTDNACAEKCWKDYPSSKADDVFNCVDSNCSKECY